MTDATQPCSCTAGGKGTQVCAGGKFGTCVCASSTDANSGDAEAKSDAAVGPAKDLVADQGDGSPETTDATPDTGASADIPFAAADGDAVEVGPAADCSTDVNCDDQNACTTDKCGGGKCTHAFSGGSTCDDGEPCTTLDKCSSKGVCIGGPDTICDDANPCTDDSCKLGYGCIQKANAAACDDGNACTTGDACKSNKCQPGLSASAGSPCSDSLACTSGDNCDGKGVCVGGQAKNCNDDNSCTQDSCSEAANGCVNAKAPLGSGCNDGKFCTIGEVCDGVGSCGQGKALDCAVGGCSAGSCNEALGKCDGQPKADGTLCDADGDACTAGDACKAGVCVVGAKKLCADTLFCTVDACDAKTGNCAFDATGNVGKGCDADANVCTVGDACKADGSCQPGFTAAIGAPCTDGNACTVGDGCNGLVAAPACKAGLPKGCDDGDSCTADACEPANGTCTHASLKIGSPCDDGKYCTTGEACDSNGKCAGGKPKVCGEGGCVLGTCDEAKKACVGQTLPDGTLCNADENGCTKYDFCQAGQCVAGAPVNCFVAGDACNNYSCQSTGADTYQCPSAPTAAGNACDDLLFCTVGDSCDGKGACKSGPARDCSGKDAACAAGICDENGDACVAKNKVDGTACNLGNPCTTGDSCKGGFCLAGASVCPATADFSVAVAVGNPMYGPPAIRQAGGGEILVGNLNDTTVQAALVRSDLSRSRAETAKTWGASSLTIVGPDTLYWWGPGSQEATKYAFGAAVSSTLYSSVSASGANGASNWTWSGYEGCEATCCSYDKMMSGKGVPWANGCVFGDCNYHWGQNAVACLTSGGITAVKPSAAGVAHVSTASISPTASIVTRPNNTIAIYDGSWSGALVVNAKNAAIGGAADGKFVVASVDGFAQKYAADGKPEGSKFPFNTTPFGGELGDAGEWPIAAASLPNGRFVIAWKSLDKQATQGSDVRAQVFKSEPGAKAGPELLVNTSVIGNQARPRIAAFSDNSFAIIWEDNAGRDGDGSGIIGQWFDATGKPTGSEIVVNGTTKGDQVLPSVSVDLTIDASNTTDLVVIAWIDNGDNGHIKLARYDKNGKRDNGAMEQQVSETKTGEQFQPALAAPRVTNLSLGDGSFVATWASENVDGAGYAVLARRYGVDGKVKGPQFQVNTFTADNQWRPDAAADQAGNFLIVWETVGEDGDLEGVYTQRYLNTGTKNGAPFRLSVQTANEQTRPKVAMQPTGAFAAAWETYGAPGGAGYDVAIRCFDKSGAPLSQDVLANTYTTDKQTRPQIASVPDGTGRFIVAWQSYDQLGVGKQDDVYARIFNATCQPVGDPFVVNTLTAGSQGLPTVEANLDGNFTVAWQQYDNATEGFNVWAQRYDKDGKAVAANFRIHDWVTADQTEPAVTYLPDGSFVITYTTAGEDEEASAIKAVKYDSAGKKTDLEWFANRTYTGAQAQSAVVGRPNGTWVYAWNSPGWDGDKGCVVMRFSNSGDCLQDSDCNDNNVCTNEKCNGGKCQTTNNTQICLSDNNPCTADDACKDGTCQGVPVNCDDKNVCTTDSCDSKTGKCVHVGMPWCNGGCFYSDKPGCGSCKCEAAVCNEKPSCCSKNWDSLCVQLCNQKFGGCDSGKTQ